MFINVGMSWRHDGGLRSQVVCLMGWKIVIRLSLVITSGSPTVALCVLREGGKGRPRRDVQVVDPGADSVMMGSLERTQ